MVEEPAGKDAVTAEKERGKPDHDKGGIFRFFVPAGLSLGLGVGFLADKPEAGLFLGLGVGFLAMVVAATVARRPGGKE